MTTSKQKLHRIRGILSILQVWIRLLIIGIRSKAFSAVRKRFRKARWWVAPEWMKRKSEGEFHTVMQVMRKQNVNNFKGYYRMAPHLFDKLCSLVHSRLDKTPLTRQCISPEERLAITLRYLASGDAIKSIALAFRVGKETARGIIHDTCAVLYDVLQPLYLPAPTKDHWKHAAVKYWSLWQFPNCIGSAYGKHITIQCPPKTGSLYYNYKGTFSTVLMAVADADYRFIYVDVGGYGKQSDGGTFGASSLGNALRTGTLDLPEPTCLPNTDILSPYVFLGDEAFQLTKHFIRPFPGKDLNDERRMFNYRLSRARRCVKNAFGILAARWRIYRRPINLLPDNVDNVVLATIALHNFLCNMDSKTSSKTYCTPGFANSEDCLGNSVEGQWRQQLQEQPALGLQDINHTSAKNPKTEATRVRETFLNYFNSDAGSVPWQWDMAHVPRN